MPNSTSRRPTIKDVAALAGVGIKTVSRVINGEDSVAAATEARIRRAIDQLQYQPDLQARNLRRLGGRSNTLGLLVGSVANPFSGAVHRAVEDAAQLRQAAVFASSLDDDPTRERAAVQAFLRRRVDGLILTTIDSSQAYLGRELDRGTPVVFVDRRPRGIDADTVLSDNYEGGRRAVAHLADGGHRRIAFLGDTAQIFTARERLRGYVDEMRARGLSAEHVVQELSEDGLAAGATAQLMGGDEPPTAIFSAQNLVTIGALRALREAGLSRSIALVGFDDLPLADLLEPGVTVIAQDPAKIGRIAAERVFARLDGDTSAAREYIVPTRLVVRGSGEIPPS